MNVVLTGASQGIGYHTAIALCRNGVENLYLISRNKNNLQMLKQKCENQYSTNIICIPIDINTILENESVVLSEVIKEPIDILINNAGYLLNKDFREITKEEGVDVFNTNFHAPAALIRYLFPALLKSKLAHVVNISSMGGYQGSSKFPGLSYYSASKAAIASLTECLAAEFSNTNIKFNCLAFGAVQTEMLSQAFPDYKAPITAKEMGEYVASFSLSGHTYYNGQILPVRLSNP